MMCQFSSNCYSVRPKHQQLRISIKIKTWISENHILSRIISDSESQGKIVVYDPVHVWRTFGTQHPELLRRGRPRAQPVQCTPFVAQPLVLMHP
jgi:hypothetical protein